MLDIGGALTILAILSPLLLIVALIIRLSSRGPALFRQTRTGASGRTFTIYKFRSMKLQPKAQEAIVQARRGDERVTSFGRFIRRTSIDELPQMLNVLNGTMSLVGPRPHAAEHDAYYVTRIPNYSLRFAVLPGLSGLAQINGARGATPRLEDMERRVAYDLAYIQSASLRSDLRILAATMREMLLSQSAY
jgi:putative colanic acid biosynthesis UDP-glucose lipid carrier transferase